MSEISKRLIDGDKLLEWIESVKRMYETHGYTNHEYAVNGILGEINSGHFDIPSNQGEAARLREKWFRARDDAARARLILASLAPKLLDPGWMDTEELNFPLDNPTADEQNEWLGTFLEHLKNHVAGVIEKASDEAEHVSSHTEPYVTINASPDARPETIEAIARAAEIALKQYSSHTEDTTLSEYQRGWDAAMAQSEAEPMGEKMARDFERKKGE
jgi:hypothetical protein